MATLSDKIHDFFAKDPCSSWINGSFSQPLEGSLTEHYSVVTKEKLCNLSFCSAKELEYCFEILKENSKTLKTLNSSFRINALEKCAELLKSHQDLIAHIITHEMGKTLRESLGEVLYCASYFSWAAKALQSPELDPLIYSSSDEKIFERRYDAIGPCFFITPWNFPLAMAGRKIATALAAGCPSVVKPCKEAPLSALVLGEIIKRAGFPDGSVNILIGSKDMITKAVMSSNVIKKVSFTGSVQTGKTIAKLCSDTVKKVTLELGGNAPFIILNDADLELAVQESLGAKLRCSGQTCVCANRFLVQKDICEAFTHALKTAVEKLKVGNPLEENVQLTNVLHPKSHEKISRLRQEANSQGASPLLNPKNTYDVEIFKNVGDNMSIFEEENFGPNIPITSFENDSEALYLANKTHFGLASYLFTTSKQRAEFFLEGLEFGMVGINDGTFSSPEFSFGGIKESGYGREGGKSGILDYLVEKMISYGNQQNL